MGLRRPRKLTVPRHPTECTLLLLLRPLPLRLQVQGAALPKTLLHPTTRAVDPEPLAAFHRRVAIAIRRAATAAVADLGHAIAEWPGEIEGARHYLAECQIEVAHAIEIGRASCRERV